MILFAKSAVNFLEIVQKSFARGPIQSQYLTEWLALPHSMDRVMKPRHVQWSSTSVELHISVT